MRFALSDALDGVRRGYMFRGGKYLSPKTIGLAGAAYRARMKEDFRC